MPTIGNTFRNPLPTNWIENARRAGRLQDLVQQGRTLPQWELDYISKNLMTPTDVPVGQGPGVRSNLSGNWLYTPGEGWARRPETFNELMRLAFPNYGGPEIAPIYTGQPAWHVSNALTSSNNAAMANQPNAMANAQIPIAAAPAVPTGTTIPKAASGSPFQIMQQAQATATPQFPNYTPFQFNRQLPMRPEAWDLNRKQKPYFQS